MRLTLATALLLVSTSLGQAQTPLTGTTGVPTSTPPLDSSAPEISHPRARAPRRTLQARFEAANTTHDGHLTEAQAQTGMPAVARNFSAIDTQNQGYVTIDDIRAYNHSRRAARGRAKSQ